MELELVREYLLEATLLEFEMQLCFANDLSSPKSFRAAQVDKVSHSYNRHEVHSGFRETKFWCNTNPQWVKAGLL